MIVSATLLCVILSSCRAIVNLTVTSPVSLSHGRSFPLIHAHGSSTVANKTNIVTESNVVNQRVSELRAVGQRSPAGLPVTSISIADVFAPLPAFYTHPVYVDSCSAFNVANEMMYQQIQFPLGDECCVTWGNSKTTDCGNFAVLAVQFNQASADVIFCYLPGHASGIINLDFMKLFDLKICGSGIIDKC